MNNAVKKTMETYLVIRKNIYRKKTVSKPINPREIKKKLPIKSKRDWSLAA